MRVMLSRALIAALTLTLGALSPVHAETLALRNAHLVSVETGRVTPNRTIVIENGRITRIGGARLPAPRGARRIDLAGAYVMPGLTDAHVHTPLTSFNAMMGSNEQLTPQSFESALAPYLAYGVTQVVLMMGGPDALAARDAQRRGEILAPIMVVASPPVSGPQPILPPPASRIALTPAEAEALAAEFARAGYDAIKLREDLTPQVAAAFARAARANGLIAMGHMPNDAHDLTEVFAAPRLGAAHLYDTIYAEPSRSGGADALAALLHEREGFVVSTLSVHANILSKNADYQASLATECARLVDPRLYALWTGISFEPSSPSDVISAEMEQHRALVRALVAADVPLLTGTDSGAPTIGPGCSLHDELLLLSQAGLSPLQVLQTATRAPAQIFPRLAASGRVARGATANLLILDANPLDDVANTRRIRAVIVGGRLLDRAALDQMLARARRE